MATSASSTVRHDALAAPTPAPAASRRAPAWLLVVTAAWLVVAVAVHLPAPLGLPFAQPISIPLIWLIKRIVEVSALVWAASRVALGPRLRQALGLRVVANGLGFVLVGLALPEALGLGGPPSAEIYGGVVSLTFVFGVASLLWMPMMPLTGVRRTEFAIDLAASVVAVLAITSVVIPWRGLVEDASLRWRALNVVGTQTLMVAAANAFVLRGIARPSRRAFWLLVANLCGNLVVSTVSLYAGRSMALASCELLTSMAGLWAAHALHDDPFEPETESPLPQWMRAFNPLPPLAVAAVGVILIRESLRDPVGPITGLAVAMLALTVLLVTRIATTSAANVRLVAEQAERDRRAEHERMQALTTLSGGIAHWFNNLMTSVMGNAELGQSAIEGRDTSFAAESLRRIAVAAERAATLTRQLLTYAGQQVRRPEPLDLSDLVRSTVAAMQTALPLDLRIVVEAPGEAAWIMGDRAQWRGVVDELVANARVAMHDRGTIALRVERRRGPVDGADPDVAADGRAHVILEVVDDGPGVPAEVLPSIFDPFFTTRGPASAAGLGLSAVKGVVEVHGGRVQAQPAPGAGLAITVAVPAVDSR